MHPQRLRSPRLAALAAHVPNDAQIADIGADHALLPCHLAALGRITQAVAVDIRPQALALARRNAQRWAVADRVAVRDGDGLSALSPGDADTIVVAGMGGPRIAEILERGPTVLARVRRLVLGPQSAAWQLRSWLRSAGWGLRAEQLVQEGDHHYLVLVAEPGQPNEAYLNVRAGGVDLSDDMLMMLGPRLVARQDPRLAAYWRPTLTRWADTLDALGAAPRSSNVARREAFVAARLYRVQRALETIGAALDQPAEASPWGAV